MEISCMQLDKSASIACSSTNVHLHHYYSPSSAATLYSPASNISVCSTQFLSPQLDMQSHPILTFLKPATEYHSNYIVAIVGQGGIGKTRLLDHTLLHLQSSHAFSFVTFIELLCDQPDDQALMRAQASLLMQLRGPVTEFQSLSHGRLALKERIQNLVAMGKSFCIAIDNVWRAQDLNKLLSGVFISPGACIIITSRIRTIADDLEDVCARNAPTTPFQSLVHEQEPLQFSAARNLLLAQVSHLGPLTYQHESILDELCTYCEGIPLVLKAVGGCLAHVVLTGWEAYKRTLMEDVPHWISLADNAIQLRGLFETSNNNLHMNSQEAFLDIASFLHGWPWDTVQTIVGVEAMKELTSFHLIKCREQQLLPLKATSHVDGNKIVTIHDFIRKQALSQRPKDFGEMDLSRWLSMDDQFLKTSRYLHLEVDSLQRKAIPLTLPMPRSCFSIMEQLTVLELCGTFECGIFGPKLLLPKSLLYLRLAHNRLTRELSNLQVPSGLRHFELEKYEQLIELPTSIYECKDLQIIRILACPVLHGFWFLSNWRSLTTLHLEACSSITQLPEDLGHLELLILHECENLQPVPQFPLKKVAHLNIKGCPLFSTLSQGMAKAAIIIDDVKSSSHLDCANLQEYKALDQVHCFQESPIHLCGKLRKLSPASIRLRLRNCTCRKLDGLGLEEMVSLKKIKLELCPNLVRLPNGICKLKSLVVLDLRGCSALEQLPPQLENLTALESLFVHDCEKLKRLPNNISGLKHLQELSVIGCTQLEELTEEIGFLRSLRVLRLVNCQNLRSLPDSICNLRSLSRIDLHGCGNLLRLPKKIGDLGASETLLLMDCPHIKVLPNSFSKLSSLSVLSMSGCTHLKSLPSNIGNLKKLTMLSLADCSSLTNLCKSSCMLQSLVVLDMQRCLGLKRFPEGFGSHFPVLENLYLKECTNLEILPKSFCHIKSLKELDLSGCLKLQHLPKKFGELISLQTLRLSGCEAIKELPDSICRLNSLITMDLQGCYMLERLPAETCRLNALKELILVECVTLGMLPKNVSGFKSLQVLDIRGSWVEKVLGAKGQLSFVGFDRIKSFFELWHGLIETNSIFQGALDTWLVGKEGSLKNGLPTRIGYMGCSVEPKSLEARIATFGAPISFYNISRSSYTHRLQIDYKAH